MKTNAILMALPLALALGACGDPGGEDTADLQPDAVEPSETGMTEETDTTADPMDDAMMADDTMMDDSLVEEPMTDDPLMEDPSGTP